MYQQVCPFITLFFLLIAFDVHAAPPLDQKGVSATVLEVGISMSIPPWVITENDSGIELDIFRLSMDKDRYLIKPLYLSFERAYKLFEEGKIDAVVNANKDVVGKGYLSEEVVTFQNYAISLASRNYPLDIPMSFLADKSIVAFQKAKQLLGEEYLSFAENNPNYQEVVKQELQINLLFIRDVDFIIMDKSIFGYYWYQAIQGNGYTHKLKDRFNQKVHFHPLFKPNPYAFLFKDKSVRDDFNRGLAILKSDGRYQAVLDNYDHLSDLYQQNQIQ